MMETIKLTVGTVCFNDREGLKKTIASVAALKKKHGIDLEFVIADGGSKDGSVEAALNSRVVDVFLRGPDQGVYNGMNKILEKATGNYIIFMNSGDYFAPNFSPEFLAEYSGKYDVVVGYSAQLFKDDVYIRPNPEKKFTQCEDPPHQSAFVADTVYTKIAYDEDKRISADRDWLERVKRNSNIIGLDQVVSVFSLGGISNSAKIKHELLKCKEDIKAKTFLLSVAKVALRSIVGQQKYYRTIYKNKYERVSKELARVAGVIWRE